jgi:hypothetical protein
MEVCGKHGVPILSIGIPDFSGFHPDEKAQSTRDTVNRLLKEKASK